MKTILKPTLTLFTILSLLFVAQAQNYKVLSTVKLESDGPEGVETYALIKSVLGTGSMEVPDLYPENHPGVKHVIEETDDIMGHHFTFLIHRDIDKDRDTDNLDRQRNEIKAYSGSEPELKAYKGESLRYHWFFQLDEGFSISNNFSHFFQLKAVGGDYSSQPVVTISGSRNSSNPEFEIIHSRLTGSEDVQLVHTDWAEANTGQWMEMEALVTYKDEGYLKVSVTNMNGDTILVTENENIDMWREGSEFVRPKWGIYRSLSSSQYLSEGEERARFADFSVQKVILNYVPVPPEQAYNPYPYNEASFIDTSITLNWTKGEGTSYHKVYFGKTQELTDAHFLDSITVSQFDITRLEANQTYYWRIDEGNEDGVTTGNTWSFTTAPASVECTTGNLLEITEVTASASSANYPVSNLSDNNFETGWTATGENQWVTFDMGTSVTLTHLMISFYEGASYRYGFLIEASADNSTFETIATYESSGTTPYYETIRTSETEARYIRYTINGTSADTAPIITELDIYGCGGNVQMPEQAQVIYPENETLNIPINLNLQWVPGSGAKTHKVYIGNVSPLTEEHLIAEITDNHINVTSLDYHQTYYWRIDEVNPAGTTTGEEWFFTTTYEVKELVIQENEEGFDVFDGAIESEYSGYTGDGYVNTPDESGAGITWVITANSDDYLLNWGYANGFTEDASAFVKINGQAIGILDFNSTQAWDKWANDTVTAKLNEGKNTIKLQALSGNGLANIDYLSITGKNMQAGAVSIEQNLISKIKTVVYPNPFTRSITIQINDTEQSKGLVEVYTLSGQQILKQNIKINPGMNNKKINLEAMPAGIYFIKVSSNSGVCTQKLVKTK